MKTRKLYYENCHLKTFRSRVLSCTEGKSGWEILLEETAFYPEGGGQPADTGTLGAVRVLHTREEGEAVVHLCDGPLQTGETVEGRLDWDLRFGRMQQHSGEHMVSGIIHRRYGFHNTGFHMGSDLVTIDFDGVIPQEDLPEIEAEANRAVWENLPVRCWIPEPEELKETFYRTKRELPWPVRIVEFPGVDSCACCGVHVACTGEIGLVKLFSAIPFRGGTRMEMACGVHALKHLNHAYDQNRQVSQAFSAKITETGEAARKMNDTLSLQKYKIAGLEKQIYASIAGNYTGNALHFQENLDSTGVRELADAIAAHTGATAAVFSGADGEGYAFCLVSRQEDLRALGKELTVALGGRGGGKPQFQQGRVIGTERQIREFFRQNWA